MAALEEATRLSTYIKEKRQELDQIMSYITLKRDKLYENKPKLVQCQFNHHHHVPEDSLDKHLKMCPYSALGMDADEIQIFLEQLECNVPTNEPVIIDSSISLAVQQFVSKETELMSHASHMTVREKFASLEGGESKSEILDSNDPILLIRYMKSWSLVPRPFCQLVPSGFHPVPFKSWLFRNLPEYHSYKHEMSGDLHIVDTILYQFNATQVVTPDQLVGRLTPYLFGASRNFVLSLWKFLSILKVQQEHKITDSTVEELKPLPTEDGKPETSLVSQIKTLAGQVATPTSLQTPPTVQLPMRFVASSSEEKRVLYDYTIELSREQGGDSKEYLRDPSLFRDDAKMLLVQAKERRKEEEKSRLELIKEMRDVRRRRASYRAKNVHITQKPIKQIFHEIIAARTEELRALWEETHRDSSHKGNGDYSNEGNSSVCRRERRYSYSRSEGHRPRERKERSRSRDRGRRKRSRSRDREGRKRSRHDRSHERERKERSRSRDRDSDREGRKRSLSSEISGNAGHRKRSKSREKSRHKSKSEHKSSSHKHKHKSKRKHEDHYNDT